MKRTILSISPESAWFLPEEVRNGLLGKDINITCIKPSSVSPGFDYIRGHLLDYHLSDGSAYHEEITIGAVQLL